MDRSEANRPIQDTIALHISKCKEEAEQQLEWLNSGGTYYSPTYRLFKERANVLRQIADIYDDMYQTFIKDSSKLEVANPVTNSTEDYSQLQSYLDDALNRLIEEVSTSFQLNFEKWACKIKEESNLTYDAPTDESFKLNIEECTSIELIEKLDSGAIQKHTSAYTQACKKLKYILGSNIDQLSCYATESNQSSVSVLCVFCIGLIEWYSKRFNWNRPKDIRIRYKLASFNRSLDALILAYSYAVVDNNNIELTGGYKFIQKLSQWLNTEGEDHIGGQSNPYYKERNGLVSQEISKFSETYLKDLPMLDDPDHLVLKLAIYIEQKVKFIIYQDSNKSDAAIQGQYFASLRHRIVSNYDPSLSDIDLDDIENMLTQKGL